jgi:hypothetical protein
MQLVGQISMQFNTQASFIGSPGWQRGREHFEVSSRGCDLSGFGANANPAPTAKLVSHADERVAVSPMCDSLKLSTVKVSLGIGSP